MRTVTAIIAAMALAQTLPVTAGSPCTVVINGRGVEAGEALTDDSGRLLLSQRALNRGLGLTVLESVDGGPWTVRAFGRSLLVRPGSRSFTVDGELAKADVRPVMRDGELFVPLQILRQALEIDADVRRDGPAGIYLLSTPGSAVTDVRDGRHGDCARVVLDLDRPTGFSWWGEGDTVVLDLPMPDEGDSRLNSVRLLSVQDDLIDQLRQGPTDSETTRVEIVHSSPDPPQVFTLPDPPRIVVDLMRAPGDVWTEPERKPVAPLPTAAGVLETRNFCTERGPVRVYVLDVDPRSPAIEVRPTLGAATIHRRATVPRMVADAGAWGGVNGGFFSRSGPPLGALVIEGEWIREPYGGRTVLGITEDGQLLMDRLEFHGHAIFEGLGRLELAALNRGHEQDDTLVMYTRRWGTSVAGARGRTRLAVDASGKVIAREVDGGAVPIPEGGFVLSGIGGMAKSLRKVPDGCSVTVTLATKPQWPNLRHAIGGGPRIVKDGRKHITAAPERFRSDVYASAVCRTAVGITPEGRLLLVVVQGMGEDRRAGMTLDELASTMIKLGAEDAMNLDGGGSTTFVAEGRMLNTPSDGVARRVSNALVVLTGETATASAAGG